MINQLYKEFRELLLKQHFSKEELDYSIVEKHAMQLTHLSKIGNSSVSLFDLCKSEHVLLSGFYKLLGLETDASTDDNGIISFLTKRVHHQDAPTLIQFWLASLKLFYSLPITERKNYKLINDYRIKHEKGHYLRIIEQHQVLELDTHGNVWLALSFIDISPDQNMDAAVKNAIVNFKTGELMGQSKSNTNSENSAVKLSAREKQILSLIQEGYLSREIAENLSLSVHTVNTHRQRILEKLNAATSIEAIKYASALGLLEKYI